ncbi:MAG: DUF4410 domain-containing protein [Candidatus Scalinduaceae bacterium]
MKIMKYGGSKFFHLTLLSVVIALAGCAGTAGRHKALIPMKDIVALGQYSSLIFDSQHTSGVPMLETDHQRIKALIIQKIVKKAHDRFEHINSEDSNPNTLHASLIFTRYEKGNAFARAMLIGLGQIHIDAQLELKDEETQELIGKFEIKKTFAWGGLYGGFTGIEGAEDGFADAVVEVLFEEK